MFDSLAIRMEQLDRHALISVGECEGVFAELTEVERSMRNGILLQTLMRQKDHDEGSKEEPPKGMPQEWKFLIESDDTEQRVVMTDDGLSFKRGARIMPWEPLTGWVPMNGSELALLRGGGKVHDTPQNAPLKFAVQASSLVRRVDRQIKAQQALHTAQETAIADEIERLRQVEIEAVMAEILEAEQSPADYDLKSLRVPPAVEAHVVGSIRTRFNPITEFSWVLPIASELLSLRDSMQAHFEVDHFNWHRAPGEARVSTTGWVVS